jgi:hypothetical protein
MKRIIRIATVFTLLLASLGCTKKEEPKEEEVPITITARSTISVIRMKLHSEPITITGWDGRNMDVNVTDWKMLKADYSWAGGTLNLIGMEEGTTTVTLAYKDARATITVHILSDK